MRFRGKLAVLAGLLLAGWALPAQAARTGWWVGGGLGNVTATGDLDGTKAYTDSTGTVAIIPGSLSSGSGLVLDGGYAFNQAVSIELLSATTTHTATSSLTSKTSSATVNSTLIGMRLRMPIVDDTMELFGRIGLSGHSVKYDSYGLTGTTAGATFFPSSYGDVTFSGSGVGYGGGIEYFLGNIGLSAGITIFNATFRTASSNGVSGALPSNLQETFTLLDLLAVYHFF